MSRLILIAFSIAVCVLLWQFGSSLSWLHETELGGFPCVLRVGHEYESYATVTYPGLCGLTLKYIKAEKPPLLTFALSTVPEGDLLASGAFTMGETEASAWFRSLWLPMQSPIRIKVGLLEGHEDLLLDCREVQESGRIRERVVLQTHHRYGSTIHENMTKWLVARVAPLALPGFDGMLPLFLLAAPILGGLVLLGAFCRWRDGPSGGDTSERI